MTKLQGMLMSLGLCCYGFLLPLNGYAISTSALAPTPALQASAQVLVPIYSINADIAALVAPSQTSTELGQPALAQLTQNLASTTLNVAERYLLAIIHANIAYAEQQYKLAIEQLELAEQMGSQLNERQLHSPEFFQLHLILAQSYAAVGHFDLAFTQKKTYLKKYRAYHRAQKAETIAQLNNKYQMNIKAQQNELLKQQTQLAASKLAESESEKIASQRNVMLLSAIALVFLMLMARQFYIRSKLRKLNQIDSLTQLFNRKVLFEQGELLRTASVHSQTPLSICVFDVDNFKAINDNYGHQVGDKVLQQIATLAKETMRFRDLLTRFGGEEFAAILPEASIEEAKAIAERLREKIAQFDFHPLGITAPVTASFGVVLLSTQHNSFDALLHSADDAMYQAKQRGRNLVVCHHNA